MVWDEGARPLVVSFSQGMRKENAPGLWRATCQYTYLSIEVLVYNSSMGQHARKKENNTQKAVSSRSWKKDVPAPLDERIAALETSIRFQREEQERTARIEELKAQVHAGTYRVDSKAIAQNMLKSPETMRLLGLGKQDLLAHKDEE